MANNTLLNDNMKNERLVLKSDIKKYMYGHMTLTPRYKTGKKWPLMYTWIVKIAIDVAQTSHMTSLQVLLLFSWEMYLLLVII